jgi:hypothetical protein
MSKEIQISRENLAGYLRTRPHPSKPGELEMYLDTQVYFLPDSTIATIPDSCAGVLYYCGDGKLEVRYPGE